MQPIFVRWKDATSSDDWAEKADADVLEPNEIVTMGFLVADHATHLIVCLSIDVDADRVSQRLTIPKGWIQDMNLYPELS